MPYIVDKYCFSDSNEYELKWSGNYGAAGEKRSPKRKATPEAIAKRNQWRKEKQAKRVMKANFTKGDLWLTILYPKGTKKPIRDVKDDMSRFLKKLRYRYRKRDEDLKFMYRIEIGSQGGVHIHMLVNYIKGDPPPDEMIQKLWSHGRVHYERFQNTEEDYERVSQYLVKEPTVQQKKKLEEMGASVKEIIGYSTSQNLIRPKPERKEYKRRTVRSIMDEGPKPTEGYYIIKESIYTGVNPFTGMSYLYYTEARIDSGGKERYVKDS